MITSEKIKKLKKSPESIYDLTPRDFEEVIAEILAGYGWNVNLTSKTRDGGYDILAIKRDVTGLESTWVIECKKYDKFRKVGVELVRNIYGVKNHIGVSNAAIVTTSEYTQDAQKFSDTKYDIQLIDINKIKEWINSYIPSPENKSYLAENRFYSCFVSYSHLDGEFAEKITSRLRESGIKVWFAPEEMKAGVKIHEQIKKAIKQFDKLLLILSPNSMKSEWVKSEIRNARKRELEEGVQVLFPISIVPMEEIRNWEYFDSDTGRDLAVEIREYLIPNFSQWKNKTSFEQEVQKVLDGLYAADEQRTRDINIESKLSISGTWKDLADNDVAFFKQIGNRIIGFYNYDGRNRIVGIYDGILKNNIFTYNWKWINGGPIGQGKMILSSDGRKLAGDWWYDDLRRGIEHVGYEKVSEVMPNWLNDKDFKVYFNL
ncbi:restriction endonuclease [Fulvivirgaceae bacterium BMA10]|uniref:Restriction endonuclease n=1 Tax=Splendidivirga corallicola TaxID=3051826 RepID=A0ABT8KUR9_9BACT|nr:restriction endonuclease [Fulvivirgaceae bacterium BMA10]